MFEEQLFNLEKIKEISLPLEVLQGNINSMEESYKKFEKETKEIIKFIEENGYIDQLNEIFSIITILNKNLKEISSENVNKFLIFKDNLIQKYKDSFRENLRRLRLDNELNKNIGIYLIANKKISKIIQKISYIPTLAVEEWMNILNSLTQNSLFLVSLKRVKNVYKKIIDDRLERELKHIPENIDSLIIEDFKKTYASEPLSLNDFLLKVESKLSYKELEEKKNKIQKAREIENFKRLKEEQEHLLESQKGSYQDYFKYSEKEFERRLRRKQRESLTELSTKQPKKIPEISEEITEKIEKFKSELENSFKEKYLIQKDVEKDPLDLIRERKKKRIEEYKKHIKQFKNKE